MRPADLMHRLEDRPFKPFRIHLSDDSKFEVVDPGVIMVGESSAVLATKLTRDREGYTLVKRWRTIALSHIVQLSDLDEPVNGKGKKRRRSSS